MRRESAKEQFDRIKRLAELFDMSEVDVKSLALTTGLDLIEDIDNIRMKLAKRILNER